MNSPDVERKSATRWSRAKASPSRLSLSPNQRAWARFKRNRLGYVSLIIFAFDARRRHVRRALQQRPAAGRTLPGRVVLPDRQQPARDALRRRLQVAHRLARPVHPPAVRARRQLRAVHAEFVRREHRQLFRQDPRAGAAQPGELARHRRGGPRRARAPDLRLSRERLVRSRADRPPACCSAS